MKMGRKSGLPNETSGLGESDSVAFVSNLPRFSGSSEEWDFYG
jgi:hypothetical protein